MSYIITRKELSPQPVLVIRRRVKRSEIAATIAEVLPRIFQFAAQNGVAIVGPPICRYSEMGPELMTLEPGMPVSGAVETPADSEVQSSMLAGGPVAATVHMGPYDKLPDAATAVREWIKHEGLSPANGMWESYVTDPGNHPDPKDWKTEVYWPFVE